jgi:RNA polymerase sigma-70 factor (ECF subfamily)
MAPDDLVDGHLALTVADEDDGRGRGHGGQRYGPSPCKPGAVADGEEVMPTMVGTTAPNPLDRQATFAELFDVHYPAVLAYCRRRVGPDQAGDAALATFEVLWRTMDAPPVQPLPWLYKVAAGQLANARRSEARRRRLVDRLIRRRGGAPAPPPDPAEATADADAARAALACLKPADRELLLLVAWEGLGPEEAAAALGVSPGTFAVRLHRARRRLEHLLAEPPPSAPKDAP